MTNRLKCKFCDWSTVKGYKNKAGKFKGIEQAQQRLLCHVSSKHQAEYEQVQQALESLEREI